MDINIRLTDYFCLCQTQNISHYLPNLIICRFWRDWYHRQCFRFAIMCGFVSILYNMLMSTGFLSPRSFRLSEKYLFLMLFRYACLVLSPFCTSVNIDENWIENLLTLVLLFSFLGNKLQSWMKRRKEENLLSEKKKTFWDEKCEVNEFISSIMLFTKDFAGFVGVLSFFKIKKRWNCFSLKVSWWA